MHGLIFTSLTEPYHYWSRPSGAYRISTELNKHGYETEVVDFAKFISIEDTLSIIDARLDADSLFVGFSTTFFYRMVEHDTGDMWEPKFYMSERDEEILYEHLRTNYPHVKIIVGGTKAPLKHMNADYYVFGYAEQATVELVKFLAGDTPDVKGTHTDRGFEIDATLLYPTNDISELGIIWNDNDGILPEETLPVEISRGCIFRCKFCSFPLNGKKGFDYIRSPASIKRELEFNYEHYGTTSYSFMDDTYNDSVHKVGMMTEMFQTLSFDIEYTTFMRLDLITRYPEMIDLMFGAGAVRPIFGIETMNRKTARRIGKGDPWKQIETLQRIKTDYPEVRLHSGFILGLPEESKQSVYDTHRFLMSGDNPLDGWRYLAMQIMRVSGDSHGFASPIELNPSAYGYTLSGTSDVAFWSNEHMDYAWSLKTVGELGAESRPLRKVTGFDYNSMLSLGFPREYLQQATFGNFDYRGAQAKMLRRVEVYKNNKFKY